MEIYLVGGQDEDVWRKAVIRDSIVNRSSLSSNISEASQTLILWRLGNGTAESYRDTLLEEPMDVCLITLMIVRGSLLEERGHREFVIGCKETEIIDMREEFVLYEERIYESLPSNQRPESTSYNI